LKGSVEQKSSTLESFVEPKNMSYESLMHYFVPAERLRRAEQIDDKEVTIQIQDDKRIEATVRVYHILIDGEAATISHDCADWERVSATKKLCKHVAKLFLSMDKENATNVLRKMYALEERWRFLPYASQ
jgi:hypothetical protein